MKQTDAARRPLWVTVLSGCVAVLVYATAAVFVGAETIGRLGTHLRERWHRLRKQARKTVREFRHRRRLRRG